MVNGGVFCYILDQSQLKSSHHKGKIGQVLPTPGPYTSSLSYKESEQRRERAPKLNKLLSLKMANPIHSSVVHLAIQATAVLLLALFCQGSSQEAKALLRWKETLPYQRILDSWAFQAQNQSPCSWRGISCDSQGSVVVINLAYTELQGTECS
ncbi:hypothetical protein PIB30_036321 [Stylosanthes scabra]|uniref:Leucine-rich repeat-containing N-terminal plant-type domain-containing protein n=1 Tax=Stylosanthes scabra TaxID=79078 RepID=A0ABU6UFD5_9FABA|nr:hypothetical protein [Stylosanthes scabra]